MLLPDDLVRKILEMADLSIDTRREFGIGPRRLDPCIVAHIDWLLSRHDGIFYKNFEKSLHNFRIPGMHVVRRPIELSTCDDGMTIFNFKNLEYFLEIYESSGRYTMTPGVTTMWITEMNVGYC